MDVTTTLNTLISNATSNQATLDALIAQLQHTTIASSDDELYDAPTFDDATGNWMLGQATANVDGLFVGCYKLPIDTINSLLSDVTVSGYTAPTSPTAPASVTVAGGTPVDLAAVANLEGQSFNSFCIRSQSAFTATVKLIQSWCCEWDFAGSDGGWVSRNWPWPSGPDWGGVPSGGSWQNGSYSNLMIMIQVPETATISAITVFFSGGSGTGTLQVGNLATNAGSANMLGGLASGVRQTFTPVVLSGGVYFGVYVLGSGTITKIQLEGTGANPFGTDSCS